MTDFNLDKRALTEITLGRALAALGEAEGFEVLIDYLDDVRANQAEFAHMTLQHMTGVDNGKNPGLWKQWLETNRSSLKPMPLLARSDGTEVTSPVEDPLLFEKAGVEATGYTVRA